MTPTLIEQAMTKARAAYDRGVGIYTSSDTRSQFSKELWSRDVSIAITSLARSHPAACIESISALIDNTQADGTIPLRIEWVRHWANYIKPLPWLKNHGIDLITRKRPYPVFEGKNGALPARDTVPALVLACAALYRTSDTGKAFVSTRYEHLDAAMEHEISFTDSDGLLVGGKLQDWADSIMRPGKLATVNGSYLRALQEMTFISAQLGYIDRAARYATQYEKVRLSYLATFWNEEKGYIRAGEHDNRVDAVANIYACLYHLGPVQSVRVQERLNKLVAPNGLLRNFSRPYPHRMIATRYKIGGIPDYHNHYTWPWVTTENILAKLSIARHHPDAQIRQHFFAQAERDFVTVSRNHVQNGDFYEVVDASNGTPVISRKLGLTFYTSSVGFMGSIATYLTAEEELEAVRTLLTHQQNTPDERG